VLGGLFMFRRPVIHLLGSADLTIEVAGQKLTIKQLSDQQTQLITDLQRQVARLMEQGTEVAADPDQQEDGEREFASSAEMASSTVPQAVLWVDDYCSVHER
jgi:hypothetical protein